MWICSGAKVLPFYKSFCYYAIIITPKIWPFEKRQPHSPDVNNFEAITLTRVLIGTS